MSESKNHSDELRKYLNGQMTAEEQHAFERMSLDDPFLADALEGAEWVGSEAFLQDSDRLKEKINGEKRSSKFVLKIAASVALLFALGITFWLSNRDFESGNLANADTSSAVLDSTENEALFEVVPQEPEAAEMELADQEAATVPPPPAPRSPDKTEVIEGNEMNKVESAVDEERFFVAEVADQADAEMEVEVNFTEPAEEPAMQMARMNATGAVSRSRPARTISGKVTDDFGDPLAGVAIKKKGAGGGSVTDSVGGFVLDEVTDTTTLQFSTAGMISQELIVGRREEVDVRMDEDSEELQEVVVSGYGAFDNEPDGYVATHPVPDYKSFNEYIEENLRYPEEARSQGLEGRVILQLTISPTGTITEIEVKRGLSAECDEEAVRLIEEGPRWSPATRDGLNIETTVRVRIKFEME